MDMYYDTVKVSVLDHEKEKMSGELKGLWNDAKWGSLKASSKVG